MCPCPDIGGCRYRLKLMANNGMVPPGMHENPGFHLTRVKHMPCDDRAKLLAPEVQVSRDCPNADHTRPDDPVLLRTSDDICAVCQQLCAPKRHADQAA